MLKTLLAILILAATATAQVPAPTVVEHPYIKPMPTEAKPAVTQLAPVTLDEWKPALKQDLDKPFYALSLLYVAGTVADIVTTKHGLDRGGIEANPLFARNGGKDAAIGLNIAVSLIPLGMAYLLQKLGHKWPARVLLTVAASIRWEAAIHNNRIAR